MPWLPAGPPAWPGRWTIASGVYRLATVRGLTDASVYLVQSGSVWVLIDTAWPHREQFIRDAAESLFGAGTRPAASLLTHSHPDYAGSALELARIWDLPVHMHPCELPLAGGRYLQQHANPLDRWLIVPLLRLMPPKRLAASQARSSLERAARGRVVIGRQQRHTATLSEVPDDQRAPIIYAYLMRAGRRVGSRAVASDASHYFGVSASPSLEEITRIAGHCVTSSLLLTDRSSGGSPLRLTPNPQSAPPDGNRCNACHCSPSSLSARHAPGCHVRGVQGVSVVTPGNEGT